jgi:hypothetical protein
MASFLPKPEEIVFYFLSFTCNFVHESVFEGDSLLMCRIPWCKVWVINEKNPVPSFLNWNLDLGKSLCVCRFLWENYELDQACVHTPHCSQVISLSAHHSPSLLCFLLKFFFPFPCKGQDWISQSKYTLNHPFTSNLEENAWPGMNYRPPYKLCDGS